MRLDRSITLNLVGPVRRFLRAPSSAQSALKAGDAPANHNPNHSPRHSTLRSAATEDGSTLNSKSLVPVLMYHSISDEPEPGVSPYYRTNTSPDVFRSQMQLLADLGYRTLCISELVRVTKNNGARRDATGQADSSPLLQHSATPTPHPAPSVSSVVNSGAPLVVITFDDGFRNFYTEAFPVLQQHGFTATMFLPTAFIGDTPRPFRPAGTQSKISSDSTSSAVNSFPVCLTWSDVRELHRAGIEFGSHTVNHPKLVELDRSQVESEIRDSKAEIERRLQQPISAFCYPYAFPQANLAFARRLAGLLAETGYTSCSTTELGRVRAGEDPFRLKRLPVNSSDDPALFRAKLEGAYDWLAAPQAAVKRVKSFLRPQPATSAR